MGRGLKLPNATLSEREVSQQCFMTILHHRRNRLRGIWGQYVQARGIYGCNRKKNCHQPGRLAWFGSQERGLVLPCDEVEEFGCEIYKEFSLCCPYLRNLPR